MTIDPENTPSVAALLKSVTKYDSGFPTDVDELVEPNTAAARILGEGVRTRERLVYDVLDFVRSNGLMESASSPQVRIPGVLRSFAASKRRTVRMIELIQWAVRNSRVAPRERRDATRRSPATAGKRRSPGLAQGSVRGTRAFLSVFAFPSDPHSVRLACDDTGRFETPCDQVLAGPEDWSAPRHADVGDVCFFYYSKRSLKNIPRVRRALDEKGRLTARLRNYLDRADRQAAQLAGKIVAYSFVSGRAHSDGRESGDSFDWQSRTLAPMASGVVLRQPLDLLKYRGELPIPHGQTIVNLQPSHFQRLVEELSGLGNELDSRLVTVTPVNISRVRVTQANWRDVACGSAHRFVNELEVRGDFVDHLLGELRDPGSTLHHEVDCRSEGRALGRVDYVVRVSGVSVPVEAKLNVRTERDLPGQMRRYLTAEALVSSVRGRAMVLRAPLSSRGLAIDAAGIYVLGKRGYVSCSSDDPLVRRTEIGRLNRSTLRTRIVRALQLK